MSLPHGLLLHQQGKLDQAESCYREHLAAEPNDDYAHCRLALCLLEMEGRKKDSLEEINRAIALEPEHDYYHAVRSIILSDLNRGKDALEAAETSIEQNPEASFNFTAKAGALADLSRWADAETELHKALVLDADNNFAKNLLANVLRNQGRQVESEIAVEQLLADDPESAYAHTNAGWAALRRGYSQQAEEHFREALRLDPDFEMAREGLLESFKGRSWIYRAYLRYVFFMARFTSGKQWAIIIGAVIIVQVVIRVVGQEMGFLVLGLYLFFASFTWLASSVGNFLVQLDRSARHALKPPEKRQGIVVTFFLVAGLATIVASFGLISPSYLFIGLSLLLASVPASLAINNDSHRGRIVFSCILGLGLISTLIGGALLLLSSNSFTTIKGDTTHLVAIIPLFCFAACTWMGNINGLRSESPE